MKNQWENRQPAFKYQARYAQETRVRFFQVGLVMLVLLVVSSSIGRAQEKRRNIFDGYINFNLEYRQVTSSLDDTVWVYGYRGGEEVLQNFLMAPEVITVNGDAYSLSTLKQAVPGMQASVSSFLGDDEGIQREVDVLPDVPGPEWELIVKLVRRNITLLNPDYPAAGRFVDATVLRHTIFRLENNSRMHFAVSPEGDEYLLASIQPQVAARIDFSQPGAIDHFPLPEGWTHKSGVMQGTQYVYVDGVAEILVLFMPTEEGLLNPLYQKLTEPLRLRNEE